MMNNISRYRVGDEIEGKVLVVSHGFQTNYERGFCNGLADQGLEVLLISSDRTDYRGLRKSVETVNLRGNQAEHRPFLVKLINFVKYDAKLMHYIVRNGNRGVIHVIGLTEPPLLRGLVECAFFRLFSRRFVLTVHDLLPHGRRSMWMRSLYKIIYRFPNHLVVHTPSMAEAMATDFHIDPLRTTVMEHGIEPFHALLSRTPKREGDGRLKLLFFGNVVRYKGLDLLLKAVAEIGVPFSLRVRGLCIDPRLTSSIERLIADSGASSSIDWVNSYVSEEEMAIQFCDADIVVLPYRHIDQSGVLFQAFRFGTPVVVTRVGSLAEYVTHETGEICEPEDHLALRDAIVRLQSRLPSVSRARIHEIGQKYSWSKTVAVLKDVYGLQEAS